VKIGEFSRGGLTRGDNRASDHDLGCQEKYVPCGIVDEGSGELAITFGSSYKTSDFIVDTIAAKWKTMDEQAKAGTSLIQLKMDNGPESSGRRTQFLHRMVQLADEINKPIQLLYYPPYHSKYNPIERCWGILELQWNGAKLIDAKTMLGWAKKMTWKGMHPVVDLSRKVYNKGISLGKAAMQAVEARLKRDPTLPKYDILINPTPTTWIRKFFFGNRLSGLDKRMEEISARFREEGTHHHLSSADLAQHLGELGGTPLLACRGGGPPQPRQTPWLEDVHIRRNGSRAIAPAQPVDAEDIVMEGLDPQAPELVRDTGGQHPALPHGFDVLEGETPVPIVLGRTASEVRRMLCGQRHEALPGCCQGCQLEIH
jgi:Rhodopirellula transposase DDE domain